MNSFSIAFRVSFVRNFILSFILCFSVSIYFSNNAGAKSSEAINPTACISHAMSMLAMKNHIFLEPEDRSRRMQRAHRFAQKNNRDLIKSYKPGSICHTVFVTPLKKLSSNVSLDDLKNACNSYVDARSKLKAKGAKGIYPRALHEKRGWMNQLILFYDRGFKNYCEPLMTPEVQQAQSAAPQVAKPTAPKVEPVQENKELTAEEKCEKLANTAKSNAGRIYKFNSKYLEAEFKSILRRYDQLMAIWNSHRGVRSYNSVARGYPAERDSAGNKNAREAGQNLSKWIRKSHAKLGPKSKYRTGLARAVQKFENDKTCREFDQLKEQVAAARPAIAQSKELEKHYRKYVDQTANHFRNSFNAVHTSLSRGAQSRQEAARRAQFMGLVNSMQRQQEQLARTRMQNQRYLNNLQAMQNRTSSQRSTRRQTGVSQQRIASRSQPPARTSSYQSPKAPENKTTGTINDYKVHKSDTPFRIGAKAQDRYDKAPGTVIEAGPYWIFAGIRIGKCKLLKRWYAVVGYASRYAGSHYNSPDNAIKSFSQMSSPAVYLSEQAAVSASVGAAGCTASEVKTVN